MTLLDMNNQMLRFVAGMGERLYVRFLRKVRKYEKEFVSRKQLVDSAFLVDNVIRNCIGFIKFDDTEIDEEEEQKGFDSDVVLERFLDRNRLHYEHYEIAKSVIRS